MAAAGPLNRESSYAFGCDSFQHAGAGKLARLPVPGPESRYGKLTSPASAPSPGTPKLAQWTKTVIGNHPAAESGKLLLSSRLDQSAARFRRRASSDSSSLVAQRLPIFPLWSGHGVLGKSTYRTGNPQRVEPKEPKVARRVATSELRCTARGGRGRYFNAYESR